MSSIVAQELEKYAIGTKIRALRRSKGIGLTELGRHSGLSAGLLSRIERGLLVPPLPTLLRIAMVFGVGLDHFFVEQERPSAFIIRKKDRLRLPNDPRQEPPAYRFESLDYPVTDRLVDIYFAEFEKEASPHSHTGREFVYLIRGRLLIRVEDSDFVLAAEDSIFFDSTHPHSYVPQSSGTCTGLVVVMGNAKSSKVL
jgi:transcriptional regulator with XRE-family HTH domain